MERPFRSKEEKRDFEAKGPSDEQLAFAKKIGNYKPNAAQFRQALARTARRYLKSKGVHEGTLEKLAPKDLELPPLKWRGMPTKGPVKIFALLIEFSDYPHSYNNDADIIRERLFGSPTTGQPLESLANYYKRSSYNKLDLSGGITLGWYNTNKKRSAVPMTDNGRESLIKEALQYYEAQGQKFAQFDNDNDGVIDYFMVFWSGPHGDWATFWWGYQTEFSDSSFKLDGKILKNYSWQWEAEKVGWDFDPQTVIHETGHALGLPDLYDYEPFEGPTGGVGGADMMDGNWLDHNSFSKWMLDWLEPTIIENGTQTIMLNPSGESQDCVALWPGLLESGIFSELFIIENRQPVANDKKLPGKGLMIWHVDGRLDPPGENFLFDNSYTEHKYVRLMEADGREDIEKSPYSEFDAADLYTPGKEFGPNTIPSSKGYNDEHAQVEVSDIKDSGSKISAIFKC